MISLPEELKDLDTAEAFLDHFDIAYDETVVRRSRLHILQRFHDYLRITEASDAGNGADTDPVRDCLARAYGDFVRSDPLTERVFKVLRDAKAPPAGPAGRIFVPLEAVTGTGQKPDKGNGT
ncbi:MAG: nitrogenase-stabilizing/protective protein NifW [Rhodospirillales bacterium]